MTALKIKQMDDGQQLIALDNLFAYLTKEDVDEFIEQHQIMHKLEGTNSVVLRSSVVTNMFTSITDMKYQLDLVQSEVRELQMKKTEMDTRIYQIVQVLSSGTRNESRIQDLCASVGVSISGY